MNEKYLFFDTMSACHETLYNQVENILDRHKMDKNISEYVPISANLFPVLALPFSQYWWVFDKINPASNIPSATNNVSG